MPLTLELVSRLHGLHWFFRKFIDRYDSPWGASLFNVVRLLQPDVLIYHSMKNGRTDDVYLNPPDPWPLNDLSRTHEVRFTARGQFDIPRHDLSFQLYDLNHRRSVHGLRRVELWVFPLLDWSLLGSSRYLADRKTSHDPGTFPIPSVVASFNPSPKSKVYSISDGWWCSKAEDCDNNISKGAESWGRSVRGWQ